MTLKPQDVMVALKLCSYAGPRPPISTIATDLRLSPSEVHGAIRRLQQSRLVHGPELKNKPNSSALEEFLLHGLRYVFPAERGQMTRGMRTSYAAEPLASKISPGEDPPPVWPGPHGETKGIALEPLYKTAPIAALRDPLLYEYLALVDALRDGRVRERKIAERELIKRLRTVNAKP